MSANPFRKNIEDIHVPILSGVGESGIVFTDQTDAVNNIPSILFALETARKRFGADAVYFRYYSDRQAYMPQMYIFDFTKDAAPIGAPRFFRGNPHRPCMTA